MSSCGQRLADARILNAMALKGCRAHCLSMCGRYTLSVSNKPAMSGDLGLQSVDRFNIAPQSQVMIQTDSGDHALAHWGIPLGGSWRKPFCHQCSV